MKLFPCLVLIALMLGLCGCGGGSSAEPLTEEEAIKKMNNDRQEAGRIQGQTDVSAH
jgi:hypothetical protein